MEIFTQFILIKRKYFYCVISILLGVVYCVNADSKLYMLKYRTKYCSNSLINILFTRNKKNTDIVWLLEETKIFRPWWGSNPQPLNYQFNALPIKPLSRDCQNILNTFISSDCVAMQSVDYHVTVILLSVYKTTQMQNARCRFSPLPWVGYKK